MSETLTKRLSFLSERTQCKFVPLAKRRIRVSAHPQLPGDINCSTSTAGSLSKLLLNHSVDSQLNTWTVMEEVHMLIRGTGVLSVHKFSFTHSIISTTTRGPSLQKHSDEKRSEHPHARLFCTKFIMSVWSENCAEKGNTTADNYILTWALNRAPDQTSCSIIFILN